VLLVFIKINNGVEVITVFSKSGNSIQSTQFNDLLTTKGLLERVLGILASGNLLT
jgi:hypothetical protein